jgi:hypothetical protein
LTVLWSSCEIQASAVLITTRVLVPFLIPTHLLVRTYMVFHIYSTSFARFYVIVTWGVMILPLVFYGFNMEVEFFFFTFNNLVWENGNHK